MTQQRRCNIVNFNDASTINIFTDASTTTYNGETYVSAGAVAIIGENYNNIIDQQVNVMKNTNNYGELYAIYLAIMMALRLRCSFPGATINILSDSKISVYGLREWSFSWLKNQVKFNTYNFINSSGNNVANQELFKHIILTICSNNLCVRFFHVKGHINFNNFKDLAYAQNKFKTMNNINIPPSTVVTFSIMNDYIDNFTRNQFKVINLHGINTNGLPLFYFNFQGSPRMRRKYKSLISK